MLLILLESLGAGCILVLIVWWTMFSDRDEEAPAANEGTAEATPETLDANPK